MPLARSQGIPKGNPPVGGEIVQVGGLGDGMTGYWETGT